MEEQDGVEMCTYISRPEDLDANLKDAYDILLLDINLRGEKTGLEMIGGILEKFPDQKIVILTSYDLENYRQRAFEYGAKDFINKSIEIGDMMERLRKVHEGKTRAMAVEMVNELSHREVEVLTELVKGDSKKEIAEKLHISERTLYNHIASIYEKFGVKNIVEAYNSGMEKGYINPYANKKEH